MKVLLIFSVALISTAVANDHCSPPTVPILIAEAGYAVETHTVVTKDGYILQMHRIPAAPTSPAARRKPVVLLMHGVLGSSADWVIMGPGRGLPYILADAGYDVWMGNARGNTYSRNHTTITNLKGKDFWDFSWHEIGIYDLPAMIDFVLELTGLTKVIYIGCSQGTTTFYVMASQRPDYNVKIKAMFSLAPIAYMGNVISPLVRLISLGVIPLSVLGEHEFLPSSELLRSVGSIFCSDDAPTQVLCTNAMFVISGFNKAQLNTTVVPTIMKYVPAGGSTNQLLHYGQEVLSKKFRQYDHGPIKNIQKYRSLYPPDYNLRLITAPVHLIYGDNDWLAAVKDVTQLYNELGNPIEMVRVLDGKWNHMDSIWGIDVKRLVFDDMLATLKKRYGD